MVSCDPPEDTVTDVRENANRFGLRARFREPISKDFVLEQAVWGDGTASSQTMSGPAR